MRMTGRAAIIVAALTLGGASAPLDPLGICLVTAAAGHHHGQAITIEGYLIVGNHGAHMLEPGCGHEINIVDSGRDFRGARAFRRVVRRLEEERLMVRIRARGTFKSPEPGSSQSLDDNLLLLLGPYLELAQAEVLTARPLSADDWRRYRHWLADPDAGEFPFGER